MRIIAEVGCNWHTIEEAKEFIKKSKELNLFATKFQCFTLKQCKEAKIPEYLVLTKDTIQELFNYGKTVKQEVFFTPMYLEIIEFLDKEVGVKYFKIRYKDNHNRKLQQKIVETNKPFFVSFLPFGSGGISWRDMIILNCIPEYPAPLEKYLAWKNMLYTHGHGISDHSIGTDLLKITLNNKFVRLWNESNYDYYFEKHIMLDNNCLESVWSCTFEELKEVLKP